MQKIGIIAEYNPFHNGHLYHIEKIKEKYPDSLLILVLNGYFLERGEISLVSKEDKVKIALENKIDLILELPFVFGTQSADTFAYYSIKILNNFGIDKVIFGSESNDLNKLKEITYKTKEESYNKLVKEYLSQGINYPTALAKALNTDFEFLPNDLLGISYLKAVDEINPTIEVETIKRTNNYHDLTSNEEVISASNIRNKLYNNETITTYIPNYDSSLIRIPNKELLFELLKYKIITDSQLENYLTVDEGIENRLKEKIVECHSIEELIESVKTKRYTYNKIQRMLTHILIGFTKKDKNNINLDYIRILGFNYRGKQYLNDIKKDIIIPSTINRESSLYKYEIKASIIYDMIMDNNSIEYEKRNLPIKKDC